jgi:hypothetical protein
MSDKEVRGDLADHADLSLVQGNVTELTDAATLAHAPRRHPRPPESKASCAPVHGDGSHNALAITVR